MKTVCYNENEWRLVPVVATEEMRQAWWTKSGSTADDDWKVMLEAAPQPPEDDTENIIINAHYTDPARVIGELAARFPLVVIAKYVNSILPGLLDFTASLNSVDTLTQPDAARDADANRYRAIRGDIPLNDLRTRDISESLFGGDDLDRAIDEALT
jgi:hypothetical protein